MLFYRRASDPHMNYSTNLKNLLRQNPGWDRQAAHSLARDKMQMDGRAVSWTR